MSSQSTSSASAPTTPLSRDHSATHRVFIGPIPEKAISQGEADPQKRKHLPLNGPSGEHNENGDEDGDDIPDIFKKDLFQLFIRSGGRAENWNEHEERGLAEEMKRRWRKSEWAAVWRRRRKGRDPGSSAASQTWVGGSFEVGQFLGTNVLDGVETNTNAIVQSENRTTLASSASHKSISGSHLLRPSLLPAVGIASVIRDRPSERSLNGKASNSILRPDGTSSTDAGSHRASFGLSASSSTSLLRANLDRPRPRNLIGAMDVQSEPAPQLAATAPLDSTECDGRLIPDRKGKGRLVRYEGDGVMALARNLEGPSNTTSNSNPTGSVSQPQSIKSSDKNIGLDEVMKDRMFVRVFSSEEALGIPFNEEKHRTTAHLGDPEWAEYLVSWRENRIELYTDHKLPLKEWFVKKKHLAFTIPLGSPATQLSLYSFVDLAFSLLCPTAILRRSTSTTRLPFFSEDDGTYIFIFKHKCRSRTYEWIWRIWRQLGGQLPSSIDVRTPRLDMKVKIDVPNADEDEISKVFDRENVIALCINTLRSVPNWGNLIEREIKAGKSVELAWRMETHLDWIWLNDDIYGHPRRWEVLCGFALKQSKTPAMLELRIADHFPTHLHLPDGTRLQEPPAVEGFLDRIKPTTHANQGLYVTTYDGNLFVLSLRGVHPPSPPGFGLEHDNLEDYAKELRQTEIKRGVQQIMHANGVADLRKILVVRRAVHPTYQPTHNERIKNDEDPGFEAWCQPEIKTQEDEDDIGGEEGLMQAPDKVQLRLRRSFELLLVTGNVVRFQAYSARVATEWIDRLRALIQYWRHRHRIDARDEMDLATARRPRLTPLTRVIHDRDYPPEPPPDASAPLPALGNLYNWCILEGCKPIIKCGKVFTRKGLYGQYKMVQLFLVGGHLVQFRIKPDSSLHASIHKKISLVDAQVCSGYLAAMTLPEGQYNATLSSQPRRYQDGLESDDREEDMLFMVWYRHERHLASSPPSLSSKRKVMVFRARSRLERDAWCYALNSQVERLTRAEKTVEDGLRNSC